MSFFTLIKFSFIHHKKDVFLFITLGSVASTTATFISIILGYIFLHIDETNQQGHLFLLISFLLALLFFAGIFYATHRVLKSLTEKMVSLLLPHTFDHVLKIPIQSKKFMPVDLAKRILDYETAISTALRISSFIFFNFITLLLLLGYMAYCSAFLAIFYLITCFLFSLIKFSFLPSVIRHLSAQLTEQGKLSLLLNEIFLKIYKIRSAHLEKKAIQKCLTQLAHSKLYEEKLNRIEILAWTLDSMIPFGLLLFLYLSLYFSSGNIKSYLLPQFILPAIQFSSMFLKLSADLLTLMYFLPHLNRINPILSISPQVCPNKRSADFKKSLILSHVYLKNSDTGRLILDDISLNIFSGEFIAIIGKSGAGKSSLFKLLLGLESISSGEIMMDGENIHHLNTHSVRKQFGVVLQTSNLFPGTLLSNITANANLTLDEAWDLAKFVKLDEEINNMPMKMNTYLSDNASESISGGQKQKILIARALATRPKILLLDEATSALDTQSQAHIHQNLKQLNITRLVIAHRHSTIVDADRIYVMEQGKIIKCHASEGWHPEQH